MTTTAAINTLLLRISENLKPIDVDSAYDEMLDDCYSFTYEEADDISLAWVAATGASQP